MKWHLPTTDVVVTDATLVLRKSKLQVFTKQKLEPYVKLVSGFQQDIKKNNVWT